MQYPHGQLEQQQMQAGYGMPHHAYFANPVNPMQVSLSLVYSEI